MTEDIDRAVAGAPLAHAVRIRIHGTVRIAEKWNAFEAEQVLRLDRRSCGERERG